jgi:hypothetical protein
MHCFNDRVREVPKISPDIILGRYFEIMTQIEMYYVREYIPTCRFLKIINSTLMGLVDYF